MNSKRRKLCIKPKKGKTTSKPKTFLMKTTSSLSKIWLSSSSNTNIRSWCCRIRLDKWMVVVAWWKEKKMASNRCSLKMSSTKNKPTRSFKIQNLWTSSRWHMNKACRTKRMHKYMVNKKQQTNMKMKEWSTQNWLRSFMSFAQVMIENNWFNR